MFVTMISTVVKAIRLRYAIALILLLVTIYWTGIHPWMINWGSTPAEQQMALPGDELHLDQTGHMTQAITIHAPPDVVWQWLAQVGQDRAGFYSYTWLENLIGVDIHNANEIHPEWQQLAVGDTWRLAPADYLWGLGKDAAVPVLISEPGHVLAVGLWGAWVIEPLDAHSSRVIVRGQSTSTTSLGGVLTKLLLDPTVFTMQRRMMLGLKARAEGNPEAPAALMAVAHIGWAVAGITVAGLFVSRRRRLPWLALPVVAALPALLASGDIQAGLAAFIATGITLLGFLVFGKAWWGAILVIGAAVMLTLLLAPNAYIAIGLAFVVLLVAALGAMAVEAVTTPGGAVHKPATPTL